MKGFHLNGMELIEQQVNRSNHGKFSKTNNFASLGTRSRASI